MVSPWPAKNIRTLSFSPADLQIEAGETVQWINVDGFHNVDGSTDTYPNNPDSFYSGDASSNDWSYSFTFTVEGDYTYQCNPHAAMGMVGSILVSSGGGDPIVEQTISLDPYTKAGSYLKEILGKEWDTLKNI